MEPIYLLLLNLFAVFLLVNENILIEKLNKLQLIIALFTLLVFFCGLRLRSTGDSVYEIWLIMGMRL